MQTQSLAVVFAITILVAWVATLAAALITQNFQGLVIVTPVLLLAAGVVLGVRPSIKKINQDRGDDDA